jgi:hypothetical protein
VTTPRKLIVGGLLFLAGVGLLRFALTYVGFFLLSTGENEAREVPLTEEYRERMRAAGFPVTLIREFEVSSHNSFNGDGTSLSACLFPARETLSLLEALKRKYPHYGWGESSLGLAVTSSTLVEMLPKEFRPGGVGASVLYGSSTNPPSMGGVALDRANGVLYFISHRM